MLNTLLLLVVASTSGADANVVYASPGGKPLHMDIHKPEKAGLRPAVLLIHGGGWMSGDKKDMAGFCEPLTKQGFVVANVQYRLAPKHKWPAMLDDVQSAVRFLRNNSGLYRIDPKRIASMGVSAGGHLALMLGACEAKEPNAPSSKVSAVVNFFGVSDFEQMLPNWSLLAEPLFGVKPDDVRSVMRAASPVTHLDKADAPVFTFHGTSDWLVPFAQAKTLDKKLKELGITHEFVQIKDSGHEIDAKRKDVRDALQRLTDWLVEHLKP
jgi:acetyl esterase/lipase